MHLIYSILHICSFTGGLFGFISLCFKTFDTLHCAVLDIKIKNLIKKVNSVLA